MIDFGSAGRDQPVLAFTTKDGMKYFKSSYSGSAGCVGVATKDGCILVADTKDPTLAPHSFTHEEWKPFIAAVKDGQFDLADGDA